jgi:hypothetical protein
MKIFNIYHYLNTFHHTIRQTCLKCLHLSVLCIYNLLNNYNTLLPYDREFNEDKLKNSQDRFH